MFNSQHPNGIPQLSLTPVPVNPKPSHRYACRQDMNSYENKMKESKIDIAFKQIGIKITNYLLPKRN